MMMMMMMMITIIIILMLMRGYTRTIEKSMITSRSLVFNNHDNNKDSVPKKSNIPVSNV